MGRVGLGMWLYSNLEDRVLNVSHLVREREKKDQRSQWLRGREDDICWSSFLEWRHSSSIAMASVIKPAREPLLQKTAHKMS